MPGGHEPAQKNKNSAVPNTSQRHVTRRTPVHPNSEAGFTLDEHAFLWRLYKLIDAASKFVRWTGTLRRTQCERGLRLVSDTASRRIATINVPPYDNKISHLIAKTFLAWTTQHNKIMAFCAVQPK